MSNCSEVRRCSPSARKLAPVITKRSIPRPARPRSRSAHASGAPTTAKRSTNSGLSAAVCAAGVAQVLIAVVGATDLGHHLAVGFGQARAGGTRHRREVRERSDRAADEIAGGVEIGMAADVDVGAERDLGRDRGRRRPRPCARGRAPTRPDRDRHRSRASRARRCDRRTRSSAAPTRRCRAAPWVARTGRATATGSDARCNRSCSLAR